MPRELPEEPRSEPEQEWDPHREGKEDADWSPWLDEKRGWGEETIGVSDSAVLPGDPGTNLLEDGVALCCPYSDCDRTDWAPDYRQAHWPTCPEHRVRMVRADVPAG